VQTTGHAVYLVNLSDRLKEALVNVGLHQVLETFDGLDELKTALEERSGEE
jgi:anti-anti-sigma regulatory factor